MVLLPIIISEEKYDGSVLNEISFSKAIRKFIAKAAMNLRIIYTESLLKWLY